MSFSSSSEGDLVPGSLRAWGIAIRPKTLPVSAAPVFVGGAVAVHYFSDLNWIAFGAALIGALLLQVASNLANDVFDFEKGADREERLGPVRTAQAGLLTPYQLKMGMGVGLGIAALIGIYLVWIGGLPIVVIGLSAIVAAVAYTGGPYPLGYNGLGDIFVFVFFGPVAVCGTVYVMAQSVPNPAWIPGICLGLLAVNVLVVNNVRDEQEDKISGKKTLVVRWGRRVGLVQYIVCIGVAYGLLLLLYFAFDNSPWILLPFASLPLSIVNARVLARSHDGKVLNRVLARTAFTALMFSILFSVGIIL